MGTMEDGARIVEKHHHQQGATPDYVDGDDDAGGDAGDGDGDGDDSYELPQHNQDATQETVGIIDLGTLWLENGGLSNLGITL